MLREVEEETGITKLKSLDDAVRQTSYFYDNGEAIFKTIFYKAFSVTNEKVTLQKEELADYRRAAREEALELLPLSMHHLLDTASRYFV